MALESLPKISPANFSPDNDLIQVYSKKGDYVGVINPSYIKSSPSGVAGAIQFSDGSAFASSSNLTWNNATNALGLGSGTTSAFIDFASNPAGSTTTVGAIRTYVDGVNLSEVMTFVENGNVGVGTGATTPAGKFDIVSDGGGQLLFSRYGGQPQINIRRSQGTFAAPTAVTSGASSVLNFQNYDGTSFGTSAQIQSVPTENQTPTAKGASLALNVVQAGTTSVINGLIVSGASTNPGSVSITTNFNAATARLSIWQTALSSTLPYFNIQETGGGELLEFSNAGNLLVGSGSPSDTARVSIKGSGSTSATTSLLVQNSGGTNLLNVNDAGNVTMSSGSTLTIGAITLFDNIAGVRQVQSGAQSLYVGTANANVTFANSGLSTFNNTGSILFRPVFNAGGILMSSTATSGPSNNFLTFTNHRNDGVKSAIINTSDFSAGGSSQPPINLFIYAGKETSTNNQGNIILSYDGTSSRGNVLIGTQTSNASAILQTDSTTQGFLPPRMTDAQIRAIVSPANGLVAYNTDINHLCCYQNGAWVKLNHSPM